MDNSTLSEIKNKDFKLVPPKFNCDCELGKIPEPFPNKTFNMIILGKPGSGKSSLATALITGKKKGQSVYRKKFHHIYLVIPEGSLKSLKKNHFKSLSHENIYHTFDVETLQDIYDKVQENSDEEENSLIYIDDLASDLKSGTHYLQNLYLRLCFNRGHLRCSMINAVQRLNCVPKSIRQATSDFIFFEPGNKAESKIIFDEMIPLDTSEYKKLINYSFRTKHDLIYHPMHTKKYYRNFNEIVGLNTDLV